MKKIISSLLISTTLLGVTAINAVPKSRAQIAAELAKKHPVVTFVSGAGLLTACAILTARYTTPGMRTNFATTVGNKAQNIALAQLVGMPVKAVLGGATIWLFSVPKKSASREVSIVGIEAKQFAEASTQISERELQLT